jgi:hypothetical protein
VLPSQPTPQDVETARVAVIFIAASLIFFRRLILVVTLAMLAVAIALGMIMLLKGMQL